MWTIQIHQDGMHSITKVFILTPEFSSSECIVDTTMGDFPTNIEFNSYSEVLIYLVEFYYHINYNMYEWYNAVIFKDYVENEELTHLIDMFNIEILMPELKV